MATQLQCKQCSKDFEVADWDRNLLNDLAPEFNGEKFEIPGPTICPQCRYQRRLIWRAELHLFKRKSDLSGNTMVSLYPPEADCVVYNTDEWWSDKWDATKYGRDFDFSRPFFEQFEELIKEVPLMALSAKANVNSDYVNSASWNKNCYLISAANHNEDCYYDIFINHSKTTVDSSFVHSCEKCYELIDSKGCYNVKYSYNCHDCSDSYFLYNCKGSRNCFGSVNLVNKQYVYMNKQLTKEEYEKKMESLELHKYSRVKEAKAFFEKHRLQYPVKYMMGEMNENVIGNSVNNNKNCEYAFDATGNWDCKYIAWFHNSKNCMDIYSWGLPGTEKAYECLEVGDSSNHVLFSVSTYNGTDVYYSYYTNNSSDIFGCVSMNSKKYCILNKQYTKEEYEALVPKIIEHMRKTGEWGEFFPMKLCPLNYNQSTVMDYVPISKEEALKLGAKWYDEPPVTPPEKKVELPDSIRDTEESICNEVLTCEETRKPYKIIPQEFKFYKENDIPLPRYSPEVRHAHRLKQRNPRELWDRNCAKCNAEIKTSYAPDRPEIVYCEPCYLAEVY